jgi:hypothetical protein
LLKLPWDWCHLNAEFLAFIALQTNGSRQNLCQFFVVDNIFNRMQEDVIVKVNQIYLVAITVVKKVFVAVKTQDQLVVVVKYLL